MPRADIEPERDPSPNDSTPAIVAAVVAATFGAIALSVRKAWAELDRGEQAGVAILLGTYVWLILFTGLAAFYTLREQEDEKAARRRREAAWARRRSRLRCSAPALSPLTGLPTR